MSDKAEVGRLILEAAGITPCIHEWQPIETAPKDGSDVIVINDRGIFIASWNESGPDNCLDEFWHVTNGKYWMDLRGMLPTHWMPLPPPPPQEP